MAVGALDLVTMAVSTGHSARSIAMVALVHQYLGVSTGHVLQKGVAFSNLNDVRYQEHTICMVSGTHAMLHLLLNTTANRCTWDELCTHQTYF